MTLKPIHGKFHSPLRLGGSKVDSAFHYPEVNQMSTRNSWGLSGEK